MGATFGRLKDWTQELLTHADLNAEIDNILDNLTPAGVDDYSLNTAQMQLTTSPLTGGGSPSLATTLGGEIERLRYQILQILGSDATYWYEQPSTTLSEIAGIVLGNSVPASRIESIGSDSYINILNAAGTAATVTLAGSANNVVYHVAGVRYTLTQDISISGMSPAVSTNNTATFNDATLSATHASTYAGEHETTMVLSSVGSNITAANGIQQAYKVVRSGTTEYFTGQYNTTGTLIEKARRGGFFLPNGTPSSRTQINNSDVVTLMKCAWIFLKDDQTLTLTYNPPVWSFSAPTTPSTGDYWFDLVTTTWKVYSALGWNESGAVLVGQAILDSTNCVAARSVEPYKVYSTLNEMDIEVGTGGTSLRPKNMQSSISVYGTLQNYGLKTEVWDATSLESGTALATAETYYPYIKETGDFVLSTFAPHDRRGDLGGFYHPSHSWRCIGFATTSASLFTTASLNSFFLLKDAYFGGPIITSMVKDAAITRPKLSALGQQISASCGTFNAGGTAFSNVTNLEVPLTTTGRPVFVGVIGDGTSSAEFYSVTSANNTNSELRFTRDGTAVSTYFLNGQATGATAVGNRIPANFFTVDTVAAGTYTYRVQIRLVAGSSTSLINAKLVAYEL